MKRAYIAINVLRVCTFVALVFSCVCCSLVSAESCSVSCLAWAKRCPGSSVNTPDPSIPFQVPATECSGNGVCLRSPTLCREGELCTAVCVCGPGYYSADCSLTAEQYAAAQASLSLLVDTMVRSLLFLLLLCVYNWLRVCRSVIAQCIVRCECVGMNRVLTRLHSLR